MNLKIILTIKGDDIKVHIPGEISYEEIAELASFLPMSLLDVFEKMLIEIEAAEKITGHKPIPIEGE